MALSNLAISGCPSDSPERQNVKSENIIGLELPKGLTLRRSFHNYPGLS